MVGFVYSYAMIAGFCFFLVFLAAAVTCAQAQTPSAPATAAPTQVVPPQPGMLPNNVPADPAGPQLKQAYELITKSKDYDGALTIVDEAVKNNPKSFAALTLRGMIYSQKKQWSSAESDFNSALVLDPKNIVVKFNLGEIKFLQKDYATARTRFEALAADPTMGDFASYKVFLCDLYGGNEAQAKKTLDGWDEETGPSFFWGNAALALFHKDTESARSWINSATTIFPPAKNQYYAQSLIDLGYLPLPPPPKAT